MRSEDPKEASFYPCVKGNMVISEPNTYFQGFGFPFYLCKTTLMMNQGLMMSDQGSIGGYQMGFFNQDSSIPNLGFLPFGCISSSPVGSSGCGSKMRENKSTADNGGSVSVEAGGVSSVQKTSSGMWPWVEEGQDLSSKRASNLDQEKHNINNNSNSLSVAGLKMKKMKTTRKKVREPRFCFKTLSDVDVLDDGYKWRKYGQKVVKNTQHPRSYYRCTRDNCRVKKRVERLAEDPRMVITTYEGRHAHSPSADEDDQSQPSSHFNFFW